MKNKYIAKRYWKDSSSPMGAVNAKAKQYDDVINLSLGDPDLLTCLLYTSPSPRDS